VAGSVRLGGDKPGCPYIMRKAIYDPHSNSHLPLISRYSNKPISENRQQFLDGLSDKCSKPKYQEKSSLFVTACV